ncbi:MAG: MATE family efflux transporter [Treponema sp.]
MTISKNVDLTRGPILRGILRFFIPIMLGTFFQQIYNTVDAIVVGRFVGKEALAAAGGGTAVYVNLLVGFFTGLASGSSIIVSHFYGAARKKELDNAVHTAVWISLFMGALMTAAGLLSASFALKIIGTPDTIFSASLSYLRIYFAGIIPMFVYNMGSGILRATGDSKSPLLILITGALINVALDLLFVYALSLGVRGAALATVICESLCSAMILVRMRRDRNFTFRVRRIRTEPHIMRKMIRLGLPSGVQSSLYTVSNLLIQSNINSFGTDIIAAWAAYGRIDGFYWMTVNSFGQALTTFSGQNFGAGKIDRIKRGNFKGLLLMIFTALFFAVVLNLTGQRLYALFTADAVVVKEGMAMLRYLSLFYVLYIPIEVFSGTIHGAGDAFRPMIITMLGVCLLRIVWLFTAVPPYRSVVTVMSCYPVTWGVTSLAFIIYFHSGLWLRRRQDD